MLLISCRILRAGNKQVECPACVRFYLLDGIVKIFEQKKSFCNSFSNEIKF